MDSRNAARCLPEKPALAQPGGLLAVHAAVLMWGFGGLFGKWIALSPWMIVFGRLLFATPVLGLVIRLSGRRFALPGAKTGVLILCNGAVLAVHWTTFFHAVQVSTVAVALFGYVSAPVFAVFMEPFAFREPFSRRSLWAAALIVAGMALIVPRWEWADATVQGLAWGLVSGFTFAVLTLVNRFLVRRLDSFALAFYLDGSALIVLSPLAFYTWQMPGSGVLILMVLQGVVFTALAHTLFIWGLRTVKVQVAAIIGSLEPIYGIVLAALLLGEIPTWRIFAGGVLILAAVIWISLAKAQPPPKPGTGTVADPQG